MKLIDIAKYPIEEIQKEIEGLEAELDKDTSIAKKTYTANYIRLDIARLRLEVHILADELIRHADVFNELKEYKRQCQLIMHEQEANRLCISAISKFAKDYREELDTVKAWLKKKFSAPQP